MFAHAIRPGERATSVWRRSPASSQPARGGSGLRVGEEVAAHDLYRVIHLGVHDGRDLGRTLVTLGIPSGYS